MIAGTYLASGAMLVISGYLFDQGALTALTQTIAWCVIFFFASAGGSSAYLTVSETFPVEIRAEAIAVFFAIAQGSARSGRSCSGRSSAPVTTRPGCSSGTPSAAAS
jgi:hypothetical protein